MAEDAKTVDDLYKDEPDTGASSEGTEPVVITDPPAAAPPVVDPTPAVVPPAVDPPGVATDPSIPGEGDPAPAAEDDRPGIERWLAEYGIEGGMVQFEDGEKVHINKLSSDEQHVVLSSLASQSRPTIEQQNELNKDEVGFLNMVRESGKPVADVIADMANQQMEKIKVMEESQKVDWDNMSEDAVYLAFLKEKNPELADEDLQEDLDRARDTKTFESNVRGIREDFKSAQDRAREENNDKINLQLDQSIEDDRKTIVETVAPITEVMGFEITDDQKNALLGDILELNDVGDSLLLEDIFSSPESILEAAWFKKYGKSSFNQMENYYKQEMGKAYSRGRDEALGKLPEGGIPPRISGLGKRSELMNKDGFGTTPEAKTVDDLYDD